MAEYIEREKALVECDWYANEFTEAEYAIMPLRGAIRNIPAADVAPVRHGRWVPKQARAQPVFARCSVCGFKPLPTGYLPLYNYCPKCGAKMDGE